MSTGESNPELQHTMTSELKEKEADRPQSLGTNRNEKELPLDRATNSAVQWNTADEPQARQRAIGKELRRMFEDIVNEPVPAEMFDLLRRIEKQETD